MLRKLLPSDREVYIRLAKEFYSSPAVDHEVDSKHFEKTFDTLMEGSPYAEGYIIEHEGKAAGYLLTATSYSQEAGGLVLWIEEIFLLPEYRKMGLGSSAFKKIEAQLSPAYTRIRLEITPQNKGAAALYKSLGFEELAYLQMLKEL